MKGYSFSPSSHRSQEVQPFLLAISSATPAAYVGSQAGVESELEPLAYTRAAATRDLSRICNLHHSSRVKDLVLLWLWCRPAAVAPIQLLAWESPYAAGAALENTKKKKSLKRWL